MSRYVVGVDLGQDDATAISIIETVPRATPPGEARRKPEFHVVYLKRLRSVRYPIVIDTVVGMSKWPALRGASYACDATGLGRPIVEALRDRMSNVYGITITGGPDVSSPGHHEYHVPKADLIAAIQLPLQSGRLRIHDHLADLEALKSEMFNFGYTRNENTGRVSMQAFSGKDDLVLSLAMGTWLAARADATGAAAWSDFLRTKATRARPRPVAEVRTLADARTAALRLMRQV